MARRKLKMTPFARFFIFILFAAPIAYLVASYYNGQDGFQNIKDLLGMDKQEQAEAPRAQPTSASPDTVTLDCEELQSRYDSMEAQLKKLQSDNLQLMKDLEERDQELMQLKGEGSAGEVQ